MNKIISQSDTNRINGRQVYVDTLTGREVPKSQYDNQPDGGKIEVRHNGPHYDAKWARHLLGTLTQSEQRLERLYLRDIETNRAFNRVILAAYEPAQHEIAHSRQLSES